MEKCRKTVLVQADFCEGCFVQSSVQNPILWVAYLLFLTASLGLGRAEAAPETLDLSDAHALEFLGASLLIISFAFALRFGGELVGSPSLH